MTQERAVLAGAAASAMASPPFTSFLCPLRVDESRQLTARSGQCRVRGDGGRTAGTLPAFGGFNLNPCE